MTTFTKNEQRIFNQIAQASLEGGILDINDFSDDELNAQQLGGVISSLVQKGKVMVDEVDAVDGKVEGLLWPIHSVHGPCFWTDYVAEGEEELITDDMVIA